ncbi:methylmalonyl-CoA mutase [Labilibaculum sp. A4]|uniref:methylmalonyl-CoA mutase family protein n=1 Tax=Labilibaculum euxinus TaxID=2686357 RepID=UPI000F620C21|nr:methylmalonyl-CoA mutase family protein [Labilibaculum euxinus]MDQ1770417.1 methylmalonyl-CoA mutase family protein [Labilibaculum euxinus]MWN75363.1 methylmalonyl-CoA mutase [Labilibaculum euxinus]
MTANTTYKLKNTVRIVTATSLFDGHDASINIMRRIIQATGAEVIHLGHNRSAEEIVDCAVQEDVQAIAISSYQGGHMEFFKYMYDLLLQKDAGHIQIFGGGGGVILPSEIKELEAYGIAGLYSPDDGRNLGLQGMINEVLEKSDYSLNEFELPKASEITSENVNLLARLITLAEHDLLQDSDLYLKLKNSVKMNHTPVVGITGTGGAGKSSLTDELIRRIHIDYPELKLAILSVDPSRKKSGGALLGDRIRMNSIHHPNIYLRSLATRRANLALSKHVDDSLILMKSAGFDCIFLESSGIGQSDTEIVDHSDVKVYVMTPDFGAATQLEKIDMLDFADLIAINKFDKQGAQDALRDVKKQYQRNNLLWDQNPDDMPVYGTVASQFNDHGVNELYHALIEFLIAGNASGFAQNGKPLLEASQKIEIVPPARVRYLSEISETVRRYNRKAEEQSEIADQLYALDKSVKIIEGESVKRLFFDKVTDLSKDFKHQNIIDSWEEKKKRYKEDIFKYKVRGKELSVETHFETLSQSRIPKIVLPGYRSWGDIVKWNLKENVPGEFPYAAGVFPFKREGEDPTRMFAGEGSPERTNKRFHYLAAGQPAVRLSTAFDSVTLYGADPDYRPDIYGKVGNAGVSVASLDDAKKLYSGFDLCDPKTSVSMTINGPAPMLVAYYMNVAVDQECEKYIRANGLEEEVKVKLEAIFAGKDRVCYVGDLPKENNGLGLLLLGTTGDQVLPAEVYQKIKEETICKIRGTVQADMLKEDQAQNTCIFSIDFALKMMGDIQQYFIENEVRNFYSVSISGYHIAEAGANPITQLAFTLSNGFTLVEYYISRGMKVDDFAPNLSFFFSNGMDPEYTVIGRVARIIWAKAMKYLYKANSRSQKLKYHIQTSGRSLHAQEIEFNDIRTTLQALTGIYDNCNSLHTNAYDEAITTPTEESVRRAMAIQIIINRELGLAKNQNPLQGSFIIEELTDLVEEAVLVEFDRLTDRGGVLGAMETMYQRSKIQSESLLYESLKHSGELPIVGVNTFLSSKGSPTVQPKEVIRSDEQEKVNQVKFKELVQRNQKEKALRALQELKETALKNENVFASLMEVCKFCTLGQITNALYEVGGQYRRNM